MDDSIGVPQGFTLDNSQNTSIQTGDVPNGFTLDNSQTSEPQEQDDSIQSPDQSLQQKSPLQFTDMLKMAALNSPQEQQNYLKSKFKFAEPNQDGSFNVGDDPTNLTPINAGNMGDAALRVLAKGAAMIPAIAGQIGGATTGAEIGTAIAPGPGTILGGIIGAGAGAAMGEGAKNLVNSKTPGYDPEKAATDNVITGLFGSGGQALGQVVSFGARNFIAPKVAAAIDGAIASGENPPAGASFLSKVLKFTANVDTKESMKGSQIGWKNITDNPSNWNPDEIDNIANDVTQTYIQKEGIAQSALNSSEKSFVESNPNAQVDAKSILQNVVSQLHNSSILDVFEGDEANGIPSSFNFKPGLPGTAKSTDVINFLKSLGATEGKGSTSGQFMIPLENQIPLKDAINAKKIWGHTLSNKEFNPTIGNIFKTAVFGEGPSPRYPNGFNGLRSAINDTAKNMAKGEEVTPGSSYLLANSNYSKLMNVKDGILEDSHGNKSMLPGWMDVQNPASVAKYLKNVNKLDAFGNQAIDNMHQQLGGDFKDRASKWAVAQAVSKAQPQILRLGIIGGLLGLAMPGSPIERAGRVPFAFALGSPTGAKIMARGLEGSMGMGNKMLEYLAKGSSNKVGTAILSQLLAKKIRRQ